VTGDDKIVEFPKAEVLPEERARRLAIEVDRLAGLPVVEWMFYLPDVAKKHGVTEAVTKKMVEATIKEREKKAREDKAETRLREQHAEKKEKKESTARREEERERQREQERAAKEAERARKEAEQLEREQEIQRKKRDVVFAEIASLPRMTHEVRLKEAAARLSEDFDELHEEFEVYFAARSLPKELEPWPEPVSTAELLTAIEVKFRRYVVTSDAIVTAATLWTPFTYVVEVATHAPKLVFTFPEREAGKSVALHVVSWMSQRRYAAIEATGASIYRIIDRLRPTVFVDEADTLFRRSTVLSHIINASWTNDGSKIPRASSKGKSVDEYDCYGAQAFGMKKLRMPDTTHSRCIICLIWPKLPHEIVDEFNYRDDDEFKVIRRKSIRWSVDHAVALQTAKPEFPAGFNNRIRQNWKMLFAIADLAGAAWSQRARNAALELETDRDEQSETIRLFQGLHDVWGDAEKRKSASLCEALAAHPSGEWADFRDKGPISSIQLAALLREFGIKPIHNLFQAGRGKDKKNRGGYRRAQFKNAWARLLQKPS
jgi:Protein of unknown function (DUF3631)